jgi:hypothetical protein
MPPGDRREPVTVPKGMTGMTPRQMFALTATAATALTLMLGAGRQLQLRGAIRRTGATSGQAPSDRPRV